MPAEIKFGCESVDTEFDRLLSAPDSEIPSSIRRHLGECARCRDLYAYLSAPPAKVALSTEICDRAQKALVSTLKPVRPTPSTRILALQLFLAFLILAVLMVSMMDTAGFRAMETWQLIAIGAVLTGGAILLSASLAWQMRPGSLHRVSARNAIVILGTAFAAGAAILFPWDTPAGFFRLGLHCLGVGSMMAVPAVALFGVLVWRGAPLGLGTLGGTLGALAGLLAMTVLQFTCGLQDAGHLVTWHGGILVLTTLVGIVIGRYGSRIRSGRNVI